MAHPYEAIMFIYKLSVSYVPTSVIQLHAKRIFTVRSQLFSWSGKKRYKRTIRTQLSWCVRLTGKWQTYHKHWTHFQRTAYLVPKTYKMPLTYTKKKVDYFNKIQKIVELQNRFEGEFHCTRHKGSSLNGEHCLTELRVICGTAGEWGKLPPVTWHHPIVRTNHKRSKQLY